MPTLSPLLILPDEQVPTYVTSHLTEVLEADPAPATVLQTRLLSMPPASRKRLQQAVLDALGSSNQSLTDHILERIEGGAVPPTVANWLRDFGTLEKLQWQAKSPAWKGLDAADQQRVGRMFEFIKLLQHDVVTTTAPVRTDEPVEPLAPSIQQLADTIGLSNLDPLVHNRFGTVIVSGIKGIRSPGQLAEILSRPIAQGGLGFDEASVQKVVNAVAPLVEQYSRGELVLTEHKLKAPEPMTMAAPTMPPLAPELTTPPVSLPPMPSAPLTMGARMIDRPTPIVSRPVRQMVQPPTPFAPVRRSNKPRRALVHDIRQPHGGLVGPIEELHRLDLQSFRRLGTDPVSMVQKVKEKIDLLASESLTKKAEGVKAWKQSPINQLYLNIGASSMAMGKSIETIIKDRTAANQPTITPIEFRAIADLNKALRF